MRLAKMAGVEGVEPSHTAPETAVLPLDDTPKSIFLRFAVAASATKYFTEGAFARQEIFCHCAKNPFGCHLLVAIEALAGIDARFALVNLGLQQRGDALGSGARLLRGRAGGHDVVGGGKPHDV